MNASEHKLGPLHRIGRALEIGRPAAHHLRQAMRAGKELRATSYFAKRFQKATRPAARVMNQKLLSLHSHGKPLTRIAENADFGIIGSEGIIRVGVTPSIDHIFQRAAARAGRTRHRWIAAV